MSNHAGMTVVPQIFIDQEGIEHLSYEHGHVMDHSRRLEVQADVFEDQSDYFTVDEEGNIEHVFDLGDEDNDEWVDSIHGDGSSESDDDDGDEFNLVEFVYDEIIDEEDLDTILEWASDNLSDDYINWFNEIIDSEDIKDIHEAINALADAYNEDL